MISKAMVLDYKSGLYGYLPTCQHICNSHKSIFCNIENTSNDDDFLLNIYCSLYGKQVASYLGYDLINLQSSDTQNIQKMLTDASKWKTALEIEPLISQELLVGWDWISLRLFEEINNLGVHLLKRTENGFTYIAHPVKQYEQTAHLIILSKIHDMPPDIQTVYNDVQFHYISILDFIQFQKQENIVL